MNSSGKTEPSARGGNIRKGEVSILMATRGRPELLAQSFASLKQSTAQKDKTVVWVYVDARGSWYGCVSRAELSHQNQHI